jgi:hypothetical protein
MKTILSGFVLCLLLISCTPHARIIRSWKSSTRTKSYNHLMIVALTHDGRAKSIVENDLEAAVARQKVSASKSLDIFAPNFSPDLLKDEMLRKIRLTGADAILTVSLINRETQAHYVPGSPGFVPGFWGYYNFWYPTMYSPGYYVQDRIYYIETNLYDAVSDELIWTAQSETYNPSSLTGFSSSLASLLTKKLIKDNIIAQHSKSK